MGSKLKPWHRRGRPATFLYFKGRGWPGVLFCDFILRYSHAVCGCAPGLKLLGFKPAACVKPWHRRGRPATFVYPNDAALAGSATAFVALHQRLLAQQKVAICSFTRSRSAAPALVALVPAQELKDEFGGQACLRLCSRGPTPEHTVRCSHSLKAAVCSFICSRSAAPAFAALVPAQEFDNDGLAG